LAPDVDTMRSDEECGVNLSNLKLGDEGFIKTPNYPGNYPPDIQCIWWLKSLENTRISIQCDQIETQPCTPDFYDYALLSPDWSWQKYTIACGNNDGKLPLSISSFKNEFAIFFRSSLKDNFKGLHCRYKVIPEPLATTLNHPYQLKVQLNTMEIITVEFHLQQLLIGLWEENPHNLMNFHGWWD